VSDEDDMDDLLDAMKSDESESSSDEADNDDSDMEDSEMDDSDLEDSDVQDSNNDETIEENMMNGDDDSMTGEEGAGITQAEVYENLKRIGELEDEKQKIQDELRERTEQLRSMLKHIDRGSILYKMLQSALADSASKSASAKPSKKSATKSAPKAAAKKATKKKGRK
jgi:hypothetical protein